MSPSKHEDETIIQTGPLERMRVVLESELRAATPRSVAAEVANRLIEQVLLELPLLLVEHGGQTTTAPPAAPSRARTYALRKGDLFMLQEAMSLLPKLVGSYASQSAGIDSAGKLVSLWVECRRAAIPLTPGEACVLQALEEAGYQGSTTRELERAFPGIEVEAALNGLRSKSRSGVPTPLVKSGTHRHWAAAL